MRTTFDELGDFAVWASDQELGHVKDLLFDDASFTIRYLVVGLNRWLPGKHVCLRCEDVADLDVEARKIRLRATRHEIDNAPRVDDLDLFIDRPLGDQGSLVARPSEHPLHEEPGAPEELRRLLELRLESDSRLQSCKDVKHDQVVSFGGDDGGMRIGRIDDFVVNLATWTVPYFVVGTVMPALGRQILIPTLVTWSVDSGSAYVRVLTDPELAIAAPAYESLDQLGGSFETQILKYYYEAFSKVVGGSTFEIIPAKALGGGDGEWDLRANEEGEQRDAAREVARRKAADRAARQDGRI